MQTFTKYFVWALVSLALSPFVLTGFFAASILGSFRAGYELAGDVFDTLGNWITSK